MVNWWNSLPLSQQIFALIAIPATAIMLVQALLLLVGVGLDTDIDGDGVPDADVDHDGLGLISIRSIVAFSRSAVGQALSRMRESCRSQFRFSSL